ncbi:hypothetical protein KACHI17_20740 [Sediminibacterium sp. KACHI17]|uniref:Outer membrane protein beta-barrel domain-containing protein n=1 Tax=Sediminibacterium sp. KACHI17 TaxID=1751071 RepID=A0AAT9GKU7_9BACT
MKRIFTIFSVFAMTVIVTNTNAQTKKETKENKSRISFGVDAGIPSGGFGRTAKWNLGGSVQADLNIAKNVLYLTANAGFNYTYAERGTKGDISMIPVKAGLKFMPVNFFYIQAEAGTSFVTNAKDIDADRSVLFTYAPQTGFLIPLGKGNFIDAGIRYESNSRLYKSSSRPDFWGLRIAYAFNLK